MLIKQNQKNSLGIVLVAIYFFAILSSVFFHQHSISPLKNIEGDQFKISKNISTQTADADSCMSCHFLHHAKFYLYQDFEYDFQSIQTAYTVGFALKQTYFDRLNFQFHLRAPPSILF